MTYYFPERFKKMPPPKDYFWRVYAVVKPDEYKTHLGKARGRILSLRKLVRNNIKVTNEALTVFNSFNEEDLSLLGNITSFTKRQD